MLLHAISICLRILAEKQFAAGEDPVPRITTLVANNT